MDLGIDFSTAVAFLVTGGLGGLIFNAVAKAAGDYLTKRQTSGSENARNRAQEEQADAEALEARVTALSIMVDTTIRSMRSEMAHMRIEMTRIRRALDRAIRLLRQLGVEFNEHADEYPDELEGGS
jgi:ABC-type glutathione transport system ATPase component